MTDDLVARAADGCFHPETEGQIAALVRHARANGKKVRVLGSTHSVWRAIVTDHFAGANTPDAEMPVVLDKYVRVFDTKDDASDPTRKLVEVQGGCHLGAAPTRPVEARIEPGGPSASDILAPSPWHHGTWEDSLTYVLQERGLALSDLGGISHQTVAGFLATGSSGGTTKWSVHASIAKLRVIDGEGNVTELGPDGPDVDWFRAAGVGLGLAGVVSTVTFVCEPTFDVVGTETISATAQASDLDFYGDRPDSGLPTLERFLLDTDYTRLMWWPQFDFDRLVVWQAARAPYEQDRPIKPYHEIAYLPVLSQVGASVIYTVLGNVGWPDKLLAALGSVRAHPAVADKQRISAGLRGLLAPPADPDFPLEPQHLLPWLTALWETLKGERHDPITLAAAWIPLVELLVTAADDLLAFALKLPMIHEIFNELARLVPAHLDVILGIFVTTGKDGAPAVQTFADRSFMGLPMDNQMDDLLMPTWFTELWIPFTPGDGTVGKVIAALRKLFDADGTPEGAYQATGPFAYELYAAKADPTFLLSPATGARDVFRVDVFWFGKNAGDPATDFYPQFWRALEPFDYRLHWGKFLPPEAVVPAERLLSRFPGAAKFREVRARVDPGDVFLTRYWRDHLAIP
jgi:hypothetical protein